MTMWFQYILCVGSSKLTAVKVKGYDRVSIHPMCRFKSYSFRTSKSIFKFQYILCVGSSEKVKSYENGVSVFQYILCVGSSWLRTWTIILLASFNTSYVSVQVKSYCSNL